MGAGLAGLFGALLVLGVLPMLLILLIGWWIGKRIAFRNLSLRDAVVASLLVCVIVFVFWYPSFAIFIEPGSERFVKSFGEHAIAVRNALSFAFPLAVISAAISWVLNYDEALRRRSLDRSQ